MDLVEMLLFLQFRFDLVALRLLLDSIRIISNDVIEWIAWCAVNVYRNMKWSPFERCFFYRIMLGWNTLLCSFTFDE